MEQKESASWISRAKAEADKGASFGDRFTGIVIVFVNVMLIGFFITHQTTSTGFFSSKFGTLEMLLLYGSMVALIITGSLDGIFGQRLLSRLFDVFGGIIFITISLAWLLIIFPFEFAYVADVLPISLRFLVQWISNDIAQGLMILGIIVLAVATAYSPIAYKFVRIKRSNLE